MRDVSFEDTKKSWDNYYKVLNNEDAEFQKEFERCTLNHTWRNSIRIIKTKTNIKQTDKIIDAGCGWGRLLLGLIQDFAGLTIVAMDYQKDALTRGKKLIGEENNSNTIRWEEGDLQALPYEDNQFDIVYSGRVFQHLQDPYKAASEIVRVLRKNGRFVVFMQNRLCPLNYNYYSRLFRPGQVKNWFKGLGLKKLSVSSMDFCPKSIASMTIEKTIEKIPILNLFGGKVVVWGEK